jgi:hypothetical protein
VAARTAESRSIRHVRDSRPRKACTDALPAAGATNVYAGAHDPASIKVTDERLFTLKLDVRQEDVGAATAACTVVSLLIDNAGIMKESTMLAESSEAAYYDVSYGCSALRLRVTREHPRLSRRAFLLEHQP